MIDVDRVLARIDRDEVVELALHLGNIDSPSGREGPVGEFVFDWLTRHGFETRKVGMLDDRFNVAATLEGSGGGYSLMFNAHMDVSQSPHDVWSVVNPNNPEYHSAWLDGDEIVGDGVVNDKGPLAAYMVAARAISEAGYPFKGDLVVTAVVGEISQEPVDEYQGIQWHSKDLGARYLVTHGVVADYCVLAEGTGFGLVWVEAGKSFFKITVYGEPRQYTPYLPERTTHRASPNAIVRTIDVLDAFERWAAEYERRNQYSCPGGTVIPKASINAIRSGHPARANNAPELCALYADVRLVPDQDPLAIRDELRGILKQLGVRGKVELYLYRRGYEAKNVERLVETVRRCHAQVFPEPPRTVSPAVSSMWRDLNVFVEMGIPTVSYAPRSTGHAMRKSFKVDALYNAAVVYARIAADLCNLEKAVA